MLTILGWLFVGLALLAALLLAVLVRRYERSSAQSLTVLKAIAAGNYAARANPMVRGLPGELARAANALAARLQEDLEKKNRQLAWFHSMLAQMEEAVLITDDSDHVVLVNAAAAARFPRAAEGDRRISIHEALGQTDALPLYQKCRKTGEPARQQVRLNAAAKVLTMELSVSRIGDDRNGAMLVLLRDLTEVVQNVQMKADFVANASHELRTPLASIRAAVETAQEAGIEDLPTTRRCMEIIGGHATRLQLLVQDLLDLSRTEDARTLVRHEPMDLNNVTQLVASAFAVVASEKGITLETDIAPEAQLFRGDERLVTLLLKNLVDNSLKFTARGRVTMRARRERRPAGPVFVLEVEDTGCGIPVEDRQRVFERFYTVNRSRGGADRGTGLGLAIVKHAVAAMSGTVELDSQVGRGTTVRCVFAAADSAEEPTASDDTA